MKADVALDLSDYTFTPDLAQAGTLPARWYTDPAFLTLEIEQIFAKTWQPVAAPRWYCAPATFLLANWLGSHW